jgi:hypothetical protein
MATLRIGNVKQLEALEIDALRMAWRQVFKSSPPKAARKEFFVRILAHALQGKAHRVLSKACVKMLSEFESVKCVESCVGGPQKEVGPGARLIRHWGGRDHEVMVMERGYAYRGASYSSLSEIARRITGARWSGPRFFGLKRKSTLGVAGKGA